MKKFLFLLALLSITVMANLPPTTSKISGDATKKTTFDFEFPHFSGTHTGTKVQLGVNGITGGGTGNTTGTATINANMTGDVTSVGNATTFNNTAFQASVILNPNLRNSLSTSLLTRPVMSPNVGDPSKYDIPSFTARFVDNYTDALNPVYTTYVYPGSTANTLASLATQDATFISIDKNGTILETVDYPTPSQQRDFVTIGGLVHNNRTTITGGNTFTYTLGYDNAAALAEFSNSIGPINRFGNVISGNATNGLKINKSAGETYQLGGNWGNSLKSPNVIEGPAQTAANFFLSWRNGSGGFNAIVTDTLVPGRYDDGTGGALQPNGIVSSNKWSLVKIYYVAVSNTIALEYGQVEYNTLDAAVAARTNQTVVNPSIAPLQFRGWLVLRGGATDIKLAADALIIDAGKISQTTGGSGAGTSTTTIQGAYNNSTTPQLTTTTALGALDLKRGSAADTDNVVRVQNGAGTATATITGAGVITGSNLTGTNTGDLLVQGQTGGGTQSASTVRAPYRQFTQTAASSWVLETDSENMLVNPSFENQTVGSGWTLGTSNDLTAATSSADLFSGSQAGYLQTTATVAFDMRQNVTPTDAKAGQQGYVSWAVKVPVGVTDGQVCSTVNNVIQNCVSTFNNNIYREYFIPTVFGTTGQSVGVLFKTTATYAAGSQIVTVDKARVNVGLPQQNLMLDTVYTAQISSTGVVSNENKDIISGNCVNGATGVYTCTFISPLFTVNPNCTYSVVNSNARTIWTTTLSTTQVVMNLSNSTTGTMTNQDWTISCQKTGADYANASASAYLSANGNYGPVTQTTITIGAVTTPPTKGTIVTDRINHSRFGSRLIADYQYEQSAGGAVGSGDYLFTLPTGLSFDSASVIFYTGSTGAILAKSIVGYGTVSNGTGILIAYDATRFRMYTNTPTATGFYGSGVFGISGANGFGFHLDAPIANWSNSNLIVGSFSGVPSVPGYEGKVDTATFCFGGSSCATNCTTGTCFVSKIGNTTAINAPTFTSTGLYGMTLGKTYANFICTGNAVIAGVGGATFDDVACTNCSSVNLTTRNSTTGTSANGHASVTCSGSY